MEENRPEIMVMMLHYIYKSLYCSKSKWVFIF
jgi:hypothetical protein